MGSAFHRTLVYVPAGEPPVEGAQVEESAPAGAAPMLAMRPVWRSSVEPVLVRGEVEKLIVASVQSLIAGATEENISYLLGLMAGSAFTIEEADGRGHGESDLRRLLASAVGNTGGEGPEDAPNQAMVGRIRAVTQGRLAGGSPPVGYRYSKDRKRWLADAGWRVTIERMFKEAKAESPLAKIASQLNADGISPPRGSAWSVAYVGKVLRNPAYKGELHQRLRGVDYVIAVPPMVTANLWEDAQAGLSARRNLPIRERYAVPALCRSLAHCSTCGSRMRVQGGGAGARPSHTRYVCPSCKGVRHPRADVVDRAVWAAVSQMVLAADVMLLDAATSAGEAPSEADAELAAVREALAKNDSKLAGLTSRWRRDLLTDGQYDHELGLLKAERAVLKRRAATAQVAVDETRRSEHQRSTLTSTIEALRGKIAAADFETRRSILLALVPLGTGSIRISSNGTFSIHAPIAVATTSSKREPDPDGPAARTPNHAHASKASTYSPWSLTVSPLARRVEAA